MIWHCLPVEHPVDVTLPVDSDNIKFARADRTDRQTHSTKQKTLLVFAGS